MPLPPLLLCVCLYLTHLPRLASSEPDADKAALLAFLAGVGRGATARARINWPTTPLACASPGHGPGWTGVTCSPDGARVVALHLPGLGLSGAVQSGTPFLVASHHHRNGGSRRSTTVTRNRCRRRFQNSNKFLRRPAAFVSLLHLHSSDPSTRETEAGSHAAAAAAAAAPALRLRLRLPLPLPHPPPPPRLLRARRRQGGAAGVPRRRGPRRHRARAHQLAHHPARLRRPRTGLDGSHLQPRRRARRGVAPPGAGPLGRRATRHARPPHGAAAAQPALQQPVGPAPRRPPAPARARGAPPPPQRLLRRAPARARGARRAPGARPLLQRLRRRHPRRAHQPHPPCRARPLQQLALRPRPGPRPPRAPVPQPLQQPPRRARATVPPPLRRRRIRGQRPDAPARSSSSRRRRPRRADAAGQAQRGGHPRRRRRRLRPRVRRRRGAAPRILQQGGPRRRRRRHGRGRREGRGEEGEGVAGVQGRHRQGRGGQPDGLLRGPGAGVRPGGSAPRLRRGPRQGRVRDGVPGRAGGRHHGRRQAAQQGGERRAPRLRAADGAGWPDSPSQRRRAPRLLLLQGREAACVRLLRQRKCIQHAS
uniref:Leucine-rich repeat-containing N-terminal plant-type domain-containing protein n=1 Tax=Zea mays TaxID=4577 RepID=A0A804MXQ9_MAIZE